jgi:hypothetical protein
MRASLCLEGGYRVGKMNSKWYDGPEHLEAAHLYSGQKFHFVGSISCQGFPQPGTPGTKSFFNSVKYRDKDYDNH